LTAARCWPLRALTRCLLALGALAGTLILATCLYLSTARGKEQLLNVLLVQLNQLLAGRVSVRRIQQLRPTTIVLEDVVLSAPAGNEVLQVHELRAELALGQLLHRQPVLALLSLHAAALDLRLLDHPNAGLLSALKTRGERTAPARSGPLPTLVISTLELRDWRVRLPASAAWTPSELQVSTLRARVAVGAAFDLELERLDADVSRAGASLGWMALRGHASSQLDSRFELTGKLCGTETQLELTLGSSQSGRAEWQDLMLELRVQQRELTAARLAELASDPSLHSLYSGALAVELRFQGSARRWQAQAQLALDAGRVSLSAEGSALDTLEATLRTERLELQRLIPGAPNWWLGGELKASARALRERAALAMELEARLALNDIELPPLTLHAELGSKALRVLELKLSDRWLALSAQGDLALDGSAQLRARGHFQLDPLLRTLRAFDLPGTLAQTLAPASGSLKLKLELGRSRSGTLRGRVDLSSRALALAGTRLELLTAQLSVDGALPQPALHADVRWAAARQGSLQLTPGRLRVQSRPGRYAFDLNGGSPSLGSFAAAGWLEPRARESRLLVTASGTIRGASWQLGMEPARRSDGGRLLLPEVHLQFAGQQASLHGYYSPRACDLVLEFARLDLLRVLTALDPKLARAGLLTGKLEARGAPKNPALTLELAGEGLALSAGPKLSATVQAQLDPTRGALLVNAHLGTGPDTDAKRQLGLLWRVDTDQMSRIETELKLADEAGPWLHLLGHLGRARTGSGTGHWLALLAAPAQALRTLERERWQLELSAEPRPLGRLPLPIGWARLGALALGARLVAEHQAGAEPSGRLDVRVSDKARPAQSGSCAARALSGQGRLQFARGRFDAELTARADDVPLLQVTTSGAFEWSAWLSGHAHRLPELEAVIAAHRLPLAELPFACERARGELTLDGRIRNSLGKGLDAELELGLVGFSLGSDQTVDAAGKLSASSAAIAWSGSLRAADGTSRFEGRLQQRAPGKALSASPGPRVDASVDLDQLPLAPFFPLQGPISQVSGSLSGQTRMDGSQPTPRLSGNVRLHDVAFTATALAQPLNEINGELQLKDDALVLNHLSAHDANGALMLDGRVTLQKPNGLRAGLDLDIRKFPLRQAGQLVAASSAKARIEIDWRPEEQDVRVQLRDADIWLESGRPPEGLALEPHPDLVVTRATTRASAPAGAEPLLPKSEARAESISPNRLLIEIDSRDGFRIERADFAFKLSTQLKILVQRPAPTPGTSGVSVSGEIRFVRGYLELLGKMFEIQAGGTLRFAGNDSTTLDLVAHYQDRRSEKLVKVHLRGTASSPKLDFSVDDAPSSAGEAFQVIYGSESSSDRTEDTEAQAKEVVSALTAGVITTSIRRRLGAIAPIVAVDPADSEGVGQVRAGFELDTFIPEFLRDIVTGIYVEGILATEKQAEQGGERDVQPGVLIELHFPYNLVTSGRYGPDTTWTIDLGWQP
jgi:autotransporter translocation and assembly factor TamB